MSNYKFEPIQPIFKGDVITIRDLGDLIPHLTKPLPFEAIRRDPSRGFDLFGYDGSFLWDRLCRVVGPMHFRTIDMDIKHSSVDATQKGQNIKLHQCFASIRLEIGNWKDGKFEPIYYADGAGLGILKSPIDAMKSARTGAIKDCVRALGMGIDAQMGVLEGRVKAGEGADAVMMAEIEIEPGVDRISGIDIPGEEEKYEVGVPENPPVVSLIGPKKEDPKKDEPKPEVKLTSPQTKPKRLEVNNDEKEKPEEKKPEPKIEEPEKSPSEQGQRSLADIFDVEIKKEPKTEEPKKEEPKPEPSAKKLDESYAEGSGIMNQIDVLCDLIVDDPRIEMENKEVIISFICDKVGIEDLQSASDEKVVEFHQELVNLYTGAQ